MIYYVFDTNVLIYTLTGSPKPNDPHNPTYNENAEIKRHTRVSESFAYLFTQWVNDEARFIVPNFVIAEVLNFFGRIHYRKTSIPLEQAEKNFKNAKDRFINQIKYDPNLTNEDKKRSRKCFFSYELNRHHLLNLDKILKAEHNTNPRERVPNMLHGKVSLSAIDLLIISVAMELETLSGKGSVFIVTTEERMCNVCLNGNFPTCYKLDAITKPELGLPKLSQKQHILSPEVKISVKS